MINLTKKDGFFTLMEVITALAVFCALVALAVPRYQMQMEKARAGEAVQNIETLYKAQRAYFHEYNAYTNNINLLEVTIRLSNYFSQPVLSTADPIVSIPRNDSSYTITVTMAGVIDCTPAGGTCDNLGF